MSVVVGLFDYERDGKVLLKMVEAELGEDGKRISWRKLQPKFNKAFGLDLTRGQWSRVVHQCRVDHGVPLRESGYGFIATRGRELYELTKDVEDLAVTLRGGLAEELDEFFEAPRSWASWRTMIIRCRQRYGNGSDAAPPEPEPPPARPKKPEKSKGKPKGKRFHLKRSPERVARGMAASVDATSEAIENAKASLPKGDEGVPGYAGLSPAPAPAPTPAPPRRLAKNCFEVTLEQEDVDRLHAFMKGVRRNLERLGLEADFTSEKALRVLVKRGLDEEEQ